MQRRVSLLCSAAWGARRDGCFSPNSSLPLSALGGFVKALFICRKVHRGEKERERKKKREKKIKPPGMGKKEDNEGTREGRKKWMFTALSAPCESRKGAGEKGAGMLNQNSHLPTGPFLLLFFASLASACFPLGAFGRCTTSIMGG